MDLHRKYEFRAQVIKTKVTDLNQEQVVRTIEENE